MTGPICEWCGEYLHTFDEHDEDDCYRRRQDQIYAAGGAKAKAALREALAAKEAVHADPS